MRSRGFDVEIELLGHTLDVTGTAYPYVPATVSGPPDSWAPAEGGEIEDLEVFMKHKRKAGGWSRRQVCDGYLDAWEKTTDLHDKIAEKLDDEADDR